MKVAVDVSLFNYAVSPKGRLEYQQMPDGTTRPVVHVGMLETFEPDIKVTYEGSEFSKLFDAVDSWMAGDSNPLKEVWPTRSPEVKVEKKTKDPFKTYLGTLTKAVFMSQGQFTLINPSGMTAFIHQELFGKTRCLFTAHPDGSHFEYMEEFERKVTGKGSWEIGVVDAFAIPPGRFFLNFELHPWFEGTDYVFLELNPFHSYVCGAMINGVRDLPSVVKFNYRRGGYTSYYEYEKQPRYQRYPWSTFAPHLKLKISTRRLDLAKYNGSLNVCTSILRFPVTHELGEMNFEQTGQVCIPVEPIYELVHFNTGEDYYVIKDKTYLYDVNDGTEVTGRQHVIRRLGQALGLVPWVPVGHVKSVKAIGYPGSTRYIDLGGSPLEFDIVSATSVVIKKTDLESLTEDQVGELKRTTTLAIGRVSLSGSFIAYVVLPEIAERVVTALKGFGISSHVVQGDVNFGTEFERVSPLMYGEKTVQVVRHVQADVDVFQMVRQIGGKPGRVKIPQSSLKTSNIVELVLRKGEFACLIPPSLYGTSLNKHRPEPGKFSLFYVFDVGPAKLTEKGHLVFGKMSIRFDYGWMFYVASTGLLYIPPGYGMVLPQAYLVDMVVAQYFDMHASWVLGTGFLVPLCAYVTRHLTLSIIHSSQRDEDAGGYSNLYVVDRPTEIEEEWMESGQIADDF